MLNTIGQRQPISTNHFAEVIPQDKQKGGTSKASAIPVESRIPYDSKQQVNAFLADPTGDPKNASSTEKALSSWSLDQARADNFAVLRLLYSVLQGMRQSGRTVKYQEGQASINASKEAAQKIRDGAADRFAAGLASGVAQLGSAAAQGINAVRSARDSAAAQNEATAEISKLKGGEVDTEFKEGVLKGEINGKTGSGTTLEMQDLSTQSPNTTQATANPATTSKVDQSTGDVKTIAKDQSQQSATEGKKAAPPMTEEERDKQIAKIEKNLNKKIAGIEKSYDTSNSMWTSVIGGTGKITEATFQQQASEDDAAKLDQETQAKAHEMRAQAAGDEVQTVFEHMRGLIDGLKTMSQSDQETNRGIARNI